MKIGGLRKLSALDFPTKICATVFLTGCNFRCPFCHNATLVTGGGESITEEEFFSFLKKRTGLLDAVCITGGEPLLYDVTEFIYKIKEMGFLVKLDTNGSFPEKLSALLNGGLIDYVAMDIKSSVEAYSKLSGGYTDVEKIKKSAALLLGGKTDFEFRTTVVKGLHTKKDMESIGKWLSGDEKYFLQTFVPSENTITQGLEAYTPLELEELRQVVLPYIPNTNLRGV